MRPDPETIRGIECLKNTFESGRILRVGAPQELDTWGFSYFFRVTAYEREWGFAATREQLSDLPAMKKYQQSADRLARILEKRFKNVSPAFFVCESGRLLEIQIEWPIQTLQPRAATCVRAQVRDARTREVAHCYVAITHAQSTWQLKEDPFQLHAALANSIRAAVDLGGLTFYAPDTEHPVALQEIRLILDTGASTTSNVAALLKQKVLLLGFRAGGKETQVWMADPWDAAYWGAETNELRQEAEILEAEGYLRLDDSHEFARAGNRLLIELREARVVGAPDAPVPGGRDQMFDVFLSHASEDKPFVRELASALEERGITYWLDEIEIKIGDSLRAVIDKGLRNSRFGVVVLSKNFFAKKWPQLELDGLLAIEIERKVILPVWHEVTLEEVREYSAILAGRFAARSEDGVQAVAEKIKQAVETPKSGTSRISSVT